MDVMILAKRFSVSRDVFVGYRLYERVLWR
jgi:hypothetical protein